ncbi:MAG: COG4315 family predicted lipoprotein [Acidimicrobiales bacterium]
MPVNTKAMRAARNLLVTAVVVFGPAGCSVPASTGTVHGAPPATTVPEGSRTARRAGVPVAVEVATNARIGPILVNRAGDTLYRTSTETAGGIPVLTCVGSCTALWHPLLLPPGDLGPVPGAGVPGHLGVVSRPDGSSQVTWQGSPLYTYAGDSAPGQTNGQGVDRTWSVVRVDAAVG